jgi:dihydroflavonol-4-reductase
VAAACAGAEVVYHLAAVISTLGDRRGLMPAVNVMGARTVADAAAAAGACRLVHMSSIHAFAHEPAGVPVDETRSRVASCDRRPAYDRSKAAGEAAVRAVSRSCGLDLVVVHPTAVIGVNDYAPSRMGRTLLALHAGRMPAVVRGGFDWVDVRDVVAGAIAAAERGRPDASYILAGHWCTVRELAELVRREVGGAAPGPELPMPLARLAAPVADLVGRLTGREPLFTSEALAALSAPHCSGRLAATELGCRPRPLADTVRDTFGWFEASGQLGRRHG